MKKVILGLAAGVLCLSLAQAKDHQVKMLNKNADGTMTFEPLLVKAAVGDTITFIPTDKGHDAKSTLVPDGAQPFSGKINEQFTYKLEKEGVYVYVCTPHRPMNMSGLVQVGKAANLDKAKEEIEKIESKAVTNKGRLKKAAEGIK
ncbi:pseudoazurin [Helicobacter jaachi]|uniref:Pseudoazurin n=1 Tax=Helicobacter jaachi TaxID=1677920 RepID=A0A4U8TD15_9HELI|nr:pseudoazurin [Helicobacter jaachi]TLD96537.1 pseudoazurin [Helicobacter jaachi]